ncbi:hypothetical protein [uncultured Tenacibaculum sp.]|uniref:hypothetical protein n=1 Tax=uncultured Tenacibaculum sp. TaxID=174713 RepID=UPI0026050496|nr:hypothetical protein [uncultured Tenacibaculum sp.]
MSSRSQKSFASKLGNAKKLKTIVTSFTEYQAPVPNASLEALTTAITNIETVQQQYNTAKADYTIKTVQRREIFTEAPDALERRLSPIRTFIEAVKGKNSTELIQITSLVNKIRGNAKPKVVQITENETETISQIERTYASRIANFKNIIDILVSLGDTYSPPNTLIQIEALSALAIAAENSTVAVDTCLSVLKPLINTRQELFTGLSQQTQSIKNFVKAQYGLTSNEYKQIKGISI